MRKNNGIQPAETFNKPTEYVLVGDDGHPIGGTARVYDARSWRQTREERAQKPEGIAQANKEKKRFGGAF